jgi:hypothetical protein
VRHWPLHLPARQQNPLQPHCRLPLLLPLLLLLLLLSSLRLQHGCLQHQQDQS